MHKSRLRTFFTTGVMICPQNPGNFSCNIFQQIVMTIICTCWLQVVSKRGYDAWPVKKFSKIVFYFFIFFRMGGGG